MTYKRMTGLSQEAFCDEMFDACRHLINWDFDRVWKNTRPYANKYTCKLTSQSDGWYQVATENCPENYGFNAIPLRVPEPGTKVELQFEGLNGNRTGNVRPRIIVFQCEVFELEVEDAFHVRIELHARQGTRFPGEL